MFELTPEQVATLERLAAQGFRPEAFPLYAHAVGVRRGNCAALLQPVLGGGMKLLGEPFYLVDRNLSVRILRGGKQSFVWKNKKVEVTPERDAELAAFARELGRLLSSSG